MPLFIPSLLLNTLRICENKFEIYFALLRIRELYFIGAGSDGTFFQKADFLTLITNTKTLFLPS